MDAVKFFIEERNRMCKSFDAGCEGCPAFNVWEHELSCAVGQLSTLDATAQIAIVEAWSAAHPRKTRQSVFLEQYPEARIGDNGVLHVDPCSISASHRNASGSCATMKRECKDCRREFWMQEVV
jgi:hypothetical protein